ncbi:MAG: rod shape-determining protein MreD [Deltaproteobacteria bacterium]|nr:rod shape-determining protein MreD [Deltaproteobacteria bacterium]
MNHFGKLTVYLLVILFFALCLMTIQTTLIGRWTLYFKPDLLLPMVVFIGFRRSILESALFAFLFGYFVELHSGLPFGMYTLSYLAIAALCHFTRNLFAADEYLTPAVGVGAAFILLQLLLTLLARMLNMKADLSLNYWIGYLLPLAGATALLSPLIFAFCSYLDRVTQRESVENGPSR